MHDSGPAVAVMSAQALITATAGPCIPSFSRLHVFLCSTVCVASSEQMGRKKGRQSSGFASKAQRRTAQFEVASRATEADDIRRPFGRGGGEGGNREAQLSQLQRLRVETGTVSLSHLRGLLRDREREDRIEYQQLRRRHMTADVGGGGGGDTSKNAAIAGEGTARHDPGWLLHLEKEQSRGKSSNRQGCQCEQRPIPTLRSLCVRSLGAALGDYVDAYGVGTMRCLLDTLPHELLTELSVSASCVSGGIDDDQVIVLGMHNHIERLALHAGRKPGEGRGKTITAEGILSIVPRIAASEAPFAADEDIHRDNELEAPESWEDECAGTLDRTLVEGCARLTHLELCNLQEEDDGSDVDGTSEGSSRPLAEAVRALCRRCPRITHLSFSASFDSFVGPSLLLHPTDGLASLLPRLEVLDLSNCCWVSEGVLLGFLSQVERLWRGGAGLRVVNVAGCQNVKEEWRKKMNMDPVGSFVISNEVQRRRRIV